MFLFPGKFAYCVVLLIALADVAFLFATGLEFPAGQLVQPLATILLFAACITMLTRLSPSSAQAEALFLRVSCLMQGIIFLLLGWIVVRVLNHATMRNEIGYADDLLSGWDQALGFDWRAYFEFVRERRSLQVAMDYSYGSLTILSAVSFLVLMLHSDLRRARFFLEAFLCTAVLCTILGILFPAKAAVATYLGETAFLGDFDTPPGLYHLEHLQQLRSSAVHSLDLQNLPGLVTFPSFHTAAGIVLMAAFWRTPLFWPAAAYSAIMIASTPVFGGHYFVDLIAGALIALAVVFVFGTMPKYRGLFRPATAAVRPAIGEIGG